MQIKYIGPLVAVETWVAGMWKTVRVGETVEVDDEDGASKCEQVDNWVQVKSPPKKAE